MAAQVKKTNSDMDGVLDVDLIFSTYGGFIYAVIRSKINDDSQANDLFQDVFISLVSRPPSGDVHNMKSYLYRVITHDIADNMRRVKKYHTKLNRYAERIRYSPGDGDPQKILIRIEETNKIFDIIEKRLRHSEAHAIILRYKNHYETSKIAEIMNINIQSVSRYISVGLKKLREIVALKESYSDCTQS